MGADEGSAVEPAEPGSGGPAPVPTPPAPVPTPPLSVAAAARRLGVAPPTLRTWDRRYGLGPSSHAPGSHRRYTAEDLARLDLMRRLLQQGVSAAEAAQVARATVVPAAVVPHLAEVPAVAPPTPPVAVLPTAPPGAAEPAAGDPAAPGAAGALAGAAPPSPAVRPVPRRGGRAADVAAAVHRAAQALDAERVSELLRAELARRGVVATWDEVVVPVLVQVGNRWAATGRGVEVEHLVSDAVQSALLAHTVTGPPLDARTRPVLLACAQDEQHSLPLHAVAGGLAERVVRSSVLGPRLPRQALADAVRRTAPPAVFVWSQSPATGDVAAVAEVPSVRPAPLVVLGGPGWRGDPPARAASRTRYVCDLAEAVEVLAAAAR